MKAGTRATRQQVENDYDTNLREEGDERYEELLALEKSVITKQRSQVADIGGIRSELRELRKVGSS